ncbi:hypothetical protein PAMP_018274 [Pampus punctatissimus]
MAVTEDFYWKAPDNHDNYTYDYTDNISDIPACTEEMGLDNMYAMLYSLIFVLGMAGNGLMIMVLLRRWRLLRITEIYLLHLALADLILLCTFPFEVVNFVSGWQFGEFLCKLTGLVKNLTFYCGNFLLACVGFDRYLAIVHAISSMQSRSLRTVHIICILLWPVCLSLSIPEFVFRTVKKDTSSSMFSCFSNQYHIHAYNWDLTNRVLNHVCFFLPLAVMTYCYTTIVVTLCNSQKSQSKQCAIRLALLITIIFCFCWLPYNITLMIKTMVDFNMILHDNCLSYNLLHHVLDVTKCLGFTHCCMNPFLYAFVQVRFRNEVIQLLCKLGCGRVCLPFIRAQGHNRPSISDAGTTSGLLI